MINNDHFHSTTDKAVSLEEDYRKISELYIAEQNKCGHLEARIKELDEQLHELDERECVLCKKKIKELEAENERLKNGELMMINTHLTNEALKQAAVIMLQAEQIHKLKISTAHALSRWAQATKIWYKLKGYAGLAARYEKIHKRFFKVYTDLKTKPEGTTKKP